MDFILSRTASKSPTAIKGVGELPWDLAATTIHKHNLPDQHQEVSFCSTPRLGPSSLVYHRATALLALFRLKAALSEFHDPFSGEDMEAPSAKNSNCTRSLSLSIVHVNSTEVGSPSL